MQLIARRYDNQRPVHVEIAHGREGRIARAIKGLLERTNVFHLDGLEVLQGFLQGVHVAGMTLGVLGAEMALDGLAGLPFAMGRSGLAKVLKGSASSPVEPERCAEFGALKHLPLTSIEQLIERLIATGQITRDEHHEYRVLSLSTLGRSVLLHDE